MRASGSSRRERRRFHRDVHGLRPLSELPDIEVPRGELDVRGWIVASGDGIVIGTVRELLADLRSMRVRYLVVELGPEGTLAGDGRLVMVAADQVEADPEQDLVIIGELRAKDVDSLLEYRRELLDRDDEAGLLRRIGVRALLDHEAENGMRRLEIPPPVSDAAPDRAPEPEAVAGLDPEPAP